MENIYCGDLDSGVVPFSPPKEIFIPTNEFSIDFHSDAFSHFDGYVLNVISIPKTLYFGFLPDSVNSTKEFEETFSCIETDTIRLVDNFENFLLFLDLKLVLFSFLF